MNLSDGRFRGLLDAAADPTVIVNGSGEIVFASALVERDFGYRPDELIGLPVETLLPERMRKRHPCYRRAFFEDPKPRPMGIGLELCARHRNGTEFPVEISLNPVQTDEGMFMSSAIRDISDREDLKERQFRAIFQQKHQLTGIVALDGTLLEANDTSLSMIGMRREDVIGTPFWETPWWSHSPELQARLQAAIASAIDGSNVQFEATHPRADGTLAFVEFSIRPIVNERNEVIFLVPESHDITERKRAEERVTSLGDVLEASINEIYLFDEISLRFLHVNQGARENLGYTMEELRELTPIDLKPGFTLESFEEEIEPLLTKAKAKIEFTATHCRKDGTEYPVEVHLQRAMLDSTPVFAAIILDITERKKAEESLRESYDLLEQRVIDRTAALRAARQEADKANAGKSRFLAAASHDLRQPLQSLGLYLSVLRRQNSCNPEIVQKMDRSIRVMGELLDALLDISKLDAGTLTPEIDDFPAQGLLDKILADTMPQADEKGLLFECAKTDCTLRSDPALLQRIVENFVCNALRYTESGKVSVRCVCGEDTARIEVTDTGIGIPVEAQETIFDEYYQLDNPVRDRRKGLGLGLAIARHIARLLDHRLDVQSAVGQGSTFSVEVPLGQPAEETGTARVAAELPARAIPPVVLFIDDDPAIVDATTMLLESADMEVHGALSGDEAMTCVADGLRPDIVVSDYRLPGVTGVEVIRSLRQKTVDDLPTILMTGDTSVREIEAAKLKNCTVLHKPVDTDQLLSVIEQSTA